MLLNPLLKNHNFLFSIKDLNQKVNNNLISGDTLFIQGCGRVDLPGSDSEQMYNSLKHLSSLPDETVLYPGHHYSEEECSTLGEVKEKNVHMRIPDLDTWKQLMG